MTAVKLVWTGAVENSDGRVVWQQSNRAWVVVRWWGCFYWTISSLKWCWENHVRIDVCYYLEGSMGAQKASLALRGRQWSERTITVTRRASEEAERAFEVRWGWEIHYGYSFLASWPNFRIIEAASYGLQYFRNIMLFNSLDGWRCIVYAGCCIV